MTPDLSKRSVVSFGATKMSLILFVGLVCTITHYDLMILVKGSVTPLMYGKVMCPLHCPFSFFLVLSPVTDGKFQAQLG